MPNVLGAFSSMDCPSHRNVYWGTSAGGTHYFDRYFRGLGYALSWPLVSTPVQKASLSSVSLLLLTVRSALVSQAKWIGSASM